MERRKVFMFGEEVGSPFLLEIRSSGDGRRALELFRASEPVKRLSRQSLELLQFLLERPDRNCSRDDILWAISPDSDHNLVDRYISYLRAALGDHDLDHSKLIRTIDGGYKFIGSVSEDGDLGSMEAYPEWNKLRLQELLRDLRRAPEADEDLRIATTGISPGLEILDIKGLLKRHLRICILFTNPKNIKLVEARNALRQDKTPARSLREIEEQIADIHSLAVQLRSEKSGASHGTLDYGLSDVMPCGFVLHSNQWALMGIFLAHTSYDDGPMFEIHAGTEAWRQLHLDWNARWNAAIKPSPDPPRETF